MHRPVKESGTRGCAPESLSDVNNCKKGSMRRPVWKYTPTTPSSAPIANVARSKRRVADDVLTKQIGSSTTAIPQKTRGSAAAGWSRIFACKCLTSTPIITNPSQTIQTRGLRPCIFDTPKSVRSFGLGTGMNLVRPGATCALVATEARITRPWIRMHYGGRNVLVPTNSQVESRTVIHRRTVSNYIWTAIVLIGIAVAAYYLLPVIGGWMSSGMGKRDTMGRPSSMDVRDNLPSK